MGAVVATAAGIVVTAVILALPVLRMWRSGITPAGSRDAADEPGGFARWLPVLGPPLVWGALGGIVVAAAIVVASGGPAYVWGALAAPVVLLGVLLLLAGFRTGNRYD